MAKMENFNRQAAISLQAARLESLYPAILQIFQKAGLAIRPVLPDLQPARRAMPP
jgi:hypothetical protein